MKKIIAKTSIFFLLCATALQSHAQSVPVGSAADQYLRFLQLTEDSSNSSSLVARPFIMPATMAKADSGLYRLLRTRLHFDWGKKAYIGVLPLTFHQQYVSHHPVLQNDGAMIPAKGYQLALSGGVYGKMGPLYFQVAPELVAAANKPYDQSAVFGSVPKGSFRKLYLGQSSVRLNAGPVALSVSSENMWWGPGVHHSLLMSNQAPGFMHVKLHSSKPLKTPIGNFEWTLLGGKLTSEKSLSYDNTFLKYTSGYNLTGAPPADRYLNAYVVSYAPRFLSGLSIGLARALQQYQDDVAAADESAFKKYLPVILKPVQKKNAQDDDLKRIDQVAAAFFRWVFTKSGAEVYGEYGFNDYKKNVRDYVMNLPHAAAYLVGFRKVFTLTPKSAIEAGAEIIQMGQTTDRLVREAGNWYVHGAIWEGYTHQNQVMGAAFASNAQTFSVAKRVGLQRTALTLQRVHFDPDRIAPRWNDWVLGIGHAQMFKGFYLDGQLQMMASQNYAWEAANHKFQLLAKAGVRYYFHD